MSEFPSDLVRLARALAQVPGERPDLTEPGSRIALHARSTTLQLVITMASSLGVGTHIQMREHRRTHRATIQNLLARATTAPLSSLGVLSRLESHLGTPAANTTQGSLSQLLTYEPATPYEQRWHRVLTAAAAARGSFEVLSATRLDRTPASAWTVATEAAALAGAVARLDEALLPACAALGTPGVQHSIGASHLRAAAHTVRDSAPARLPSMASVVSAATAESLTVHTPRDLIEAMDRLPRLLRECSDLRVDDIRQTCTVLRLGLHLTADLLDDDHARELADVISEGTQRDMQIRPVVTPQEAPADLQEQLLGMVSFLTRARLGLTHDPGRAESMKPTFRAFRDFAPSVLHTSRLLVRAHLDAATWASTVGPLLLPLQRFQPLPPHCQQAGRQMRIPRLLAALDKATQLVGPDRKPSLDPPLHPHEATANQVLTQLNSPRSPINPRDLDEPDPGAGSYQSRRHLDDLARRALIADQPAPTMPLGPPLHAHAWLTSPMDDGLQVSL